MTATVLPLAVAALYLAALLAPLLVRVAGPRAGYLLATVTGAATVGVATLAPGVLDGEPVEHRTDWLPQLGVEVAFRLDALSLFFALLVLVVGTLVLLYCPSYVAGHVPRHGRFYGVLTAFAASMLGLVLAADGVALYVFWELTAVASFLLIAQRDHHQDREAARRALLITVSGGFALLAAVLLAGTAADTFELAAWVSDPTTLRGSLGAVLPLLLLAAATKSVQVPFHVWLPGAMAAPTPVSAFLHAAAMVQAGVYLLARTVPLFAARPGWQLAVLALGLATAVTGAAAALRRHDLKAVLAYSTVSQLGMAVALLGVGTHAAVAAAVVYTLAHALYKAALFLVTGTVDHHAGTRDLRELRSLRRSLPLTTGGALLAVASMAGLPPLLGYVAKEEAFAVLGDAVSPGAAGVVAVAAAVAAAALTTAYSLRLAVEGFLSGGPDRPPPDEGSPWSWAVPGVLAVAGLGLGVFVARLSDPIGAAATAATGASEPTDLGLWHGATAALWLSVAALAAGVGLFLARRRLLEPAHLLDGADLVDRLVVGLRRLGGTVARPLLIPVPATHLAAILVTALAAAAAGWIVRPLTGPWVWDAPATEWAVVILLAAATWVVVRANDRLAAIAALAAVGFLVAAFYVLRGAPDLVLTQLLVDVLTVALIVFVFRHLPRDYPAVGAGRRLSAGLLAIGVGGVTAAGTALIADEFRMPEVSQFYLETAPAEGAANVVNAVLTDFRALDTLGELTVVAVAALGVVTMSRFIGGEGRTHDANVILRQVTRVLAPIVLLLGLYLLVRGHESPGGGFIAALVVGLVVVLRYFAFGPEDIAGLLRVRAGGLIGIGLLAAIATGAAGWLWGSSFLETATWRAHLPGIGELELSSSLLFEMGVFVTVVAVVVAVVQELGAEGGP